MSSSVVSYIRVSTARQGASGLGLEAQRAAVGAYCSAHGVTLAREFKEVESGKNSDRAVLRQAIAFAKRARCKLLIAKLDTLARNVAFIANLMDSDIDFTAYDLPEANRLLLHVMAAVAQAEAKAISDRTTAALSARKPRGGSLGGSNPASRNLTREAAPREVKLAVKPRQLGLAISIAMFTKPFGRCELRGSRSPLSRIN